MINKKFDKIVNDPIYGFITINNRLILNLIEHSYFQRLRRISQLGLTHLVYPGAIHSRFQHAIGCMYLATKAINQLQKKGHKITKLEENGLKIAILLHDIGHGPFSHALENSIVNNIPHERISYLFMEELNKDYEGDLTLAIKIFKNKYKKKFLHQLVTSQLDLDRLDYLKRDSFFTGVTEGNIGSDRIINMLNVVNDKLVIEEKGIYSIEKFLSSRRLMYWQVYFHKTVVSAENMLIQCLKRAKELVRKNNEIYTTPSLLFFLKSNFIYEDFKKNNVILDNFANLDDYDIYNCLKYWRKNSDFVLSSLSDKILNRRLLKVMVSEQPPSSKKINNLVKTFSTKNKCTYEEAKYFIFCTKISNNIYDKKKSNISILMKNNSISDLSSISDQHKINSFNNKTEKYFLCYTD